MAQPFQSQGPGIAGAGEQGDLTLYRPNHTLDVPGILEGAMGSQDSEDRGGQHEHRGAGDREKLREGTGRPARPRLRSLLEHVGEGSTILGGGHLDLHLQPLCSFSRSSLEKRTDTQKTYRWVGVPSAG
jgi:hypothetical protein